MFFFLFCFFTFFLVYLSYVSAFLLIACSSSSFVFSFRLRLLLIDRHSSHFKDINLLSLECRCVLQYKTSLKKKKVWQGQLFHVRVSCHTCSAFTS